MSSTNHTTNYNLPQYVGSDKPAWLGDINPAMSAIDTAMHANAVKAQQGVDDASTAQTRADSAYTLADSAKTDAGTAQTTANTAIGNASAVDTKLNNFMLKFNLSNFQNITTIPHTGTLSGKFTLAQNSDGSIFKFYGSMEVVGQGNISGFTNVAGLTGVYGIPTGLYLTTAPSEAYIINTGGLVYKQNMSNYAVSEQNRQDIAVGTDGQIYIWALNWQPASININSGYAEEMLLPACLYFNGSFGDDPNA